MSKKSGKQDRDAERAHRNTAKSIVFAHPIRDALGAERSELTEDEAQWELTVQQVRVASSRPTDPMLIGASAKEEMTVFVPCYRVTQVTASGKAVGLMVPVEQVRCVRQPLLVVELTDEDGGPPDRQLIPPRVVAQMEAEEAMEAAKERGDSPAH